MWIAKPVNALSEQEISAWIAWTSERDRRGEDIPLSQRLTWARAADAVGGRSFAVFSPDEGVGGIVLLLKAPEGGDFECVNGPILDWDSATALPRQFATFALAVSKLDRSFRSLTLRPRWEAGQGDARLLACPVPARCSSEAATKIVSLSDAADPAISARLGRSVARTERSGFETRWEPLSRHAATRFAERMRPFAASRGFFAPPAPWFEALASAGDLSVLESISFWQCSATGRAQAGEVESQLLVALAGTHAHYLFGLESRPEGIPSALSPAALAQLRAIAETRARGARSYDLNGYVRAPASDHPYLGVNRFKDQFQGKIVDYFVPEFVIS